MMNNLFKSVAVFLLVSTFFSAASFSQEVTTQQVGQKFTAFNNAHPLEKLFVHTDKNFYLVGEIVWFKLYDDKQDQISKLAYVDLLDAGNRSVLAAKISLKEYENNGSLLLPLSLNSGNYILRAYTNWMKNTAEMSFFEKSITVVNPFKNPDTSTRNYTAGYDVNFFPEGGNLVKGIQSRIGFKANDRYGKGVDCKGYIVNDKNEQVATFQSFRFGMGNFMLTPSEKNYKAIINFPDGSSTTKALPAVNDNGYVMTVSNSGENISVEVKTSYTGPQNIYLYVQNQQALRFSENRVGSDGIVLFTIPREKLGKGVIQFTAFNANNLPVCERLYFIKPERQAVISASTNSPEYGTRKKVQVSISAKDKGGNPVAANMSISVFPADSMQNTNVADVESYFGLTSDIRGFVESPAFYFSDDVQSEQAADNLMLTQGWRRFNWNAILGKTNSPVVYLPEYAGHFITVQLTDTRNNQPATGKEVYFSVPGKPFEFFTAISDQNGFAHFNLKELYGLKKIIVQVNSPDKSAYRIDLLSPFFAPVTTAHTPFYLPDAPSLLEQYSINMQVQNIYNADSMRMFYAHDPKDSLPFYGKTPYGYNLDDYTRFTTMEEVLREYVREINVVARNGSHYLRILDESRQEYNEDGLLVLWDGVPLQDPHNIFKFDPQKAKRLEVIPRRYAAGEALFKGVASFTTYNGDLSGFPIDANMLATDYEGLQLQREFYSPSYETAEQASSRMPDFRNTLFWSPNVITNSKGETKLGFYTSDKKGKYLAVLQGLDTKGNPLVKSFSFEVK